jgi:hypothetical protein
MTFASAVVRSMIGRWNTMACVSGRGQRRLPPVGSSRPWIRRSRVLLPAPLGPSTTVRGAASARETSSTMWVPLSLRPRPEVVSQASITPTAFLPSRAGSRRRR